MAMQLPKLELKIEQMSAHNDEGRYTLSIVKCKLTSSLNLRSQELPCLDALLLTEGVEVVL